MGSTMPEQPRPARSASADFRRMIGWIASIGVLMVIGALWYLSATGDGLTVHMAAATVAGVFFSVLLGCGLFAAAFYSDKSGHDRDAADATRTDRD